MKEWTQKWWPWAVLVAGISAFGWLDRAACLPAASADVGLATRVVEAGVGLSPTTGSVVYVRFSDTPTDGIRGVVAGIVSKVDTATWTFSRSYELGVPSLNTALQEAMEAVGSGDWSTFVAPPLPPSLKGTRNVQTSHVVDWYQFPAAAAPLLLPPS